MSTMTDIAAASPFASAKRADRPRRNRLDLCRDDRGQWWQAIIGVVNGTVVVKGERRHGCPSLRGRESRGAVDVAATTSGNRRLRIPPLPLSPNCNAP